MRTRAPFVACSVDGCIKPRRTKAIELCSAHYFRLLRNGDVGSPEVGLPPRLRKPTPCIVTDCDLSRGSTMGYCYKHARRVRSTGSIEAGPTAHYGPENASWRGEDVAYRSAHDRVRRARGTVRAYSCVDCGKPARHWSYNHRDPNEKRADPGGWPYSADPDYYEPRCVSCHKLFDLARKKKSKVGGALGAARKAGR